MSKIIAWLRALVSKKVAPEPSLSLLRLPKNGCLRVIDNGVWHEFELADVLVVVLPNHPVQKCDPCSARATPVCPKCGQKPYDGHDMCSGKWPNV